MKILSDNVKCFWVCIVLDIKILSNRHTATSIIQEYQTQISYKYATWNILWHSKNLIFPPKKVDTKGEIEYTMNDSSPRPLQCLLYAHLGAFCIQRRHI